MKYRLLWTQAATATVSFALCWVLTPKSAPSQGAAATAQSVHSGSSISSSSQSDASAETIVRTRVATRDEKKTPAEPRVSLPLATIAGMIREKSKDNFDFCSLRDGMKNSLSLLGVSDREKSDVLELLKNVEAEIHAEEKNLIRVVQIDASEIRLDNQAMEGFSKTIAPKIQDGIRASLPADLAEVLISSTEWDRIYPTGEDNFPVFTITRAHNGGLKANMYQSARGFKIGIEPKFKDDGTPIPVNEAFRGERLNPLLKGLTLLPKDEE